MLSIYCLTYPSDPAQSNYHVYVEDSSALIKGELEQLLIYIYP